MGYKLLGIELGFCKGKMWSKRRRIWGINEERRAARALESIFWWIFLLDIGDEEGVEYVYRTIHISTPGVCVCFGSFFLVHT